MKYTIKIFTVGDVIRRFNEYNVKIEDGGTKNYFTLVSKDSDIGYGIPRYLLRNRSTLMFNDNKI